MASLTNAISFYSTAVRVLESALWTLSVFAIAFGSRHLYRVYDLANVALFVLAGLLWTA